MNTTDDRFDADALADGARDEFEIQARALLAEIADMRRLLGWCLENFGKVPDIPFDLDAREREVRRWQIEMRDMFARREQHDDEPRGERQP